MRIFQRSAFLTLLCALLMMNVAELPAQNELKSILKYFKNWRYGMISLYDLRNPTLSNVRKLLIQEAGGGGNTAALDTLDPALRTAVERAARLSGGVKSRAIQQLMNQGVDLTPAVDAALEEAIRRLQGPSKRIENVYIVTTRESKENFPPVIIAMIVSSRGKAYVEDNLRAVQEDDIYTIDELRSMTLDTSYGASTLYEYLENAIVQGAVRNVTAEAQGIGDIFTNFAPKVYGVSEPLEISPDDPSDVDIQRYMRVSEGQALDYARPQEVRLSYDVISYRRYPVPEDLDSATLAEGLFVFNETLPEYGLAVRYGLEEINYPSLWSERLAVMAMWQNVQLGVVLPTSGWASLASTLGQERKLTYAGWGVQGMFDFPIRLIPRSGVFHLGFSYVFDDAQPSPYKNRNTDPLTFREDPADNDYLIRAHGQLHYTFGMTIDEDHLLRLGLGATVYALEYWRYQLKQPEDPREDVKVVFRRAKTETIGGISGRLEYMARKFPTPFGGSIQYFDEALSFGAWLQVPIIAQVAVRLDAKAYIVAFRDPHPWENKSVFIPSLSFVLNF